MTDQELRKIVKENQHVGLRVGDRVRIKDFSEITLGAHYGEPGYVQSMKRMGGTISYITKVSERGDFKLLDIDYYWHESWLERARYVV